MCEPASMIIVKSGDVYWSKISDSHEDIIKENNLNDKTEYPDFVRIEITPENKDFRKPIDEWKFKRDQDLIPDWYSDKWAEKLCRKELNNWMKYHVFINRDGVIEETKSIYVYGKSDVNIKKMTGGNAWSHDTSKMTIESMTGGYAWSYDTSKMTILKRS